MLSAPHPTEEAAFQRTFPLCCAILGGSNQAIQAQKQHEPVDDEREWISREPLVHPLRMRKGESSQHLLSKQSISMELEA